MAGAIFGTHWFSFFGAGNGSLRARSAVALLFATVWVAGSALAVPCVWTGAGGDGKWSSAANWQDGVRPSCTEDDTIEIDIGDASATLENDLEGVSVTKLTVRGVNDKVLTLTGKPIAFTGASSGNTVICTNTCSVAFDVDLLINGSGKFVLGGPSSVFNGDVTVTGSHTLKFFGRPPDSVERPQVRLRRLDRG